jgi:hypothetical protein
VYASSGYLLSLLSKNKNQNLPKVEDWPGRIDINTTLTRRQVQHSHSQKEVGGCV